MGYLEESSSAQVFTFAEDLRLISKLYRGDNRTNCDAEVEPPWGLSKIPQVLCSALLPPLAREMENTPGAYRL